MKNSKFITLATAVAALFATVSCSNMSSNTTYPAAEYAPVSENCPNGCGENTCCQVTAKNIAIAAKMRAENSK
jgi:hypothetical protein